MKVAFDARESMMRTVYSALKKPEQGAGEAEEKGSSYRINGIFHKGDEKFHIPFCLFIKKKIFNIPHVNHSKNKAYNERD